MHPKLRALWQTTIYLRFHVVVRLFSNRLQMTSKCGKNKKVAHEAIAECVTDVLTTFWRPLWSIYWTDVRQHGVYLFYTIKKQTTTAFLFQNLSQLLESRPLPTSANTKKAIWRNLLSKQNEAISLVTMRSKELWLVHKNHATVILDLKDFAWNENLQRRQNWTAKSTNLKENTGKIKSVFAIMIRTALWFWILPWILQELKEYVRKTCACG